MSGFVAGFGLTIASGGTPRQAFRAGVKGGILSAASYGLADVISAKFAAQSRESILAHGVSQGALSEVTGGKFRTGALAGMVGAATPRYDNAYADVAVASFSGGVSAEISGGKFANGAVTFGFLRLAGVVANYATRETDRLKQLACSTSSNQICDVDARGVLRTDGTRGSDWSLNPDQSRNWLTTSGMAKEGSGLHWYDPGQPLDNKAIRYFVTDVSKIHDWFNSWNYNSANGLYMSRGAGFDSIFQVYSFAGMPVAAAATTFGYAANMPLEQKMLYYNIYQNSRRK